MGNKIVVAGSANVDFVIHSAKMPKLGETLVGSNFQINAGGKGLNQAIAIAKLGGDVSFLGAIGNDSNGGYLLDTLTEHGVPFQGVKSPDHTTGTAMITVVDGNNFIILNGGANESLTPEVIDDHASIIADSDFVVMQLEIPVESVLRVCEVARENGTKVVLNPAPFKALPEKVYTLVDYLIPNEHEAQLLTGITIDSDETAVESVKKLRALGVEHCIITLGDKGCAYNDGDDIILCPAVKATAVDTTSAGDCFVGALVTKLQKGATLAEGITYATKASAIAVSREGASKSIPYASEIE